MTLYARLWSHIPILAGELVPGLWVRIPDTFPDYPWALVSTVLYWGSDTVPVSHPIHDTPLWDQLVELRQKTPATYVLVELVTDPLPPKPLLRDGEQGFNPAILQPRSAWHAFPKMLELVTLALQTPAGMQLGFWPEPLSHRQDT